MSALKIKRARELSTIGDNPTSFAAMANAIPADVIAALPARLIAQLVDANWQLAGTSKAIAARDAISEGAVWDERRGAFREIAH